MSRLKLSHGRISIKMANNHKSSELYEYNASSPKVPLSKTFMSNFRDLGLSRDEKKCLKREYRQELCNLRNIDQSFFIKSYRSLIENLDRVNESSDEPIIIKADTLGSFICLAAIFSGEIPAHAEWRFELDECPLPLFPKELVKVSGASNLFNISFRCSDKSWIKPFPSLRKSPSYMSFQGPQDYEEWRLKSA